MIQTGKVLSIHADKAVVVIPRQSACAHSCAECGGCSTMRGSVRIEVKNSVGAKENDRVSVRFSDKVPLLLMFLVFMVPVLLVIGVYALSTALSKSSLLSGSLAVLSAGVYLCFLKLADKKIKPENEGEIVAIL